jgi:hypothetical protein
MPRQPKRTENVGLGAAAAITGAVTSATMSTAVSSLMDNPRTRFMVAQVGNEIVVVKGMRKPAALSAAEEAVGGRANRTTARTFDTRQQAYRYAQEQLGASVTRDLGYVTNPGEIRRIKRRCLR